MSKRQLRKENLAGVVENNGLTDITDEELALINSYTRRELGKDDVYVFSVVLCDNDVDRDGERFTVEALFELEKLFVGKTGIIDHSPSAKNQAARIFSCEVEQVAAAKTATGDDYFRLRARAYMPRSKKNEELILAIDSGIIKEVSVGCAVEEVVCSICGEDIAGCRHQKGKTYSGHLCCGELSKPYDAYEWSFVAVPSQKRAGVIKSYQNNGKEKNMEEILKNLENEKSFMLSDEDCKKLKGYIDGLKQSARDGVYYRDSLTGEVLRLSAIVQPEISRDTMESVAKSMTVAQLREFKTAFEKQKNSGFEGVPQLYGKKNKNKADLNGQFRI